MNRTDTLSWWEWVLLEVLGLKGDPKMYDSPRRHWSEWDDFFAEHRN